jgi:hypothetical protein
LPASDRGGPPVDLEGERWRIFERLDREEAARRTGAQSDRFRVGRMLAWRPLSVRRSLLSVHIADSRTDRSHNRHRASDPPLPLLSLPTSVSCAAATVLFAAGASKVRTGGTALRSVVRKGAALTLNAQPYPVGAALS